MTARLYTGAVVFVAGVHYSVGKDGHADTTRPLRIAAGGWRPAEDGEPRHNDVHHAGELELAPGSED